MSTGKDPCWTVADVAAFLNVPKQTLYTWRKRRYGPKAGRVGKHLRYDETEVRAWFEQQKNTAA